jgi:hypothetical protein
MGWTDVAAFDPVFFLHHMNVDRMLALWQVSNYDEAKVVIEVLTYIQHGLLTIVQRLTFFAAIDKHVTLLSPIYNSTSGRMLSHVFESCHTTR